MRFPSVPQTVLALWASSGTCDPAVLPDITGLTHSGNGCPQSTTVDRSGNFNELTFTMGSFASEPSTTSNCAVHFQAVGASPGWQAGIKKVHVTGREVLAPGASLEVFMTVFWSQDPTNDRTARVHLTNPGGDTERKTTTVTVDFGENLLWSPCSGGDGYMGIFNANFRTVSSAGAFFGNRAGVKPTERLEWVWRKC